MRREAKILTGAFVFCALLLVGALFAVLPQAGGAPLPSSVYFEDEGDKINVNQAPAAELMCLEGIGEKRADAIVAYREEHGPFSCAEDLMKVTGISDGILAKIREDITF